LKVTRTAFHKFRRTALYEADNAFVEDHKKQVGFSEYENNFKFKPDERLLQKVTRQGEKMA
jgi:hypothetical protein